MIKEVILLCLVRECGVLWAVLPQNPSFGGLESGRHRQDDAASAAAAVVTRAAQSPPGPAGGQAHAGLTQAPICHGEEAPCNHLKDYQQREGSVTAVTGFSQPKAAQHQL